MENNKNKKSVKFQGDMLIFCDFIQVFVFTGNHHLNEIVNPRTRVKINIHPLRPPTRVSSKANFRSNHTLMHVLKKVVKRKNNELFRQHNFEL